MKYYLIAGEASGDLHGSNLMKSIAALDPEADFRCWGGDLMESAGGVLVKHYRDLAFMGFLEVVKNLSTISRNFAFCRKDLAEFGPDVLILIDYPGFNLRMARYAHRPGLRIFYYISPQVWAWHRSRVKKIARYVHRMFVILPFEKEFYEKYGQLVDFVGHPLLDAIGKGENLAGPGEFRRLAGISDEKIIAVLPGSRKQEIARMLPVMLSLTEYYPDYLFVVAGAPSVEAEFYKPFLGGKRVSIVYNKTYDLLSNAYAAVVTSGTATLETALFKVPEVVCYSGNHLSYLLAKMLIRVKFISLVNLIMDEMIVMELIQREFNPASLKRELDRIVSDESYRATMLKNMEILAQRLGGQGASDNAAALMIRYLKT